MIKFHATYYRYDDDYEFGIDLECSINSIAESDYSIWEYGFHKASDQAITLGAMLIKIELISL